MGCTNSRGENHSGENLVSLERTPWKLLCTCTLSEWAEGNHTLGFQACMDFCAKKDRLQPWCLEGRHFDVLLPAPVDHNDLDVAYVHDEMMILSENPWFSQRVKLKHNYRSRLPSKKQSLHLQNAQAVGYRENTLVVQVARCDSKSEFVIIDMASNKVKGSHVEYFVEQPYLYECYVSPDQCHFLLKPNFLFSLKHRVQNVDDVVKVLSPAKQDRVYHVALELFRESALELIACFDPRYRHTRVALANLNRRRQHVICLYCLKSRRIMKKSYGPLYQRVQNMSFSPGGELLSTLLVTYSMGPELYPQKYNFIGAMVYETSNLQLLRKIQGFGTSAVSSLLPGALFPVFCRLGDKLALGSSSGTGSRVSQVDVYRLPPVLNLRHMCRLKISANLSEEEIDGLPVSQTMKDYLLYKPLDD